MARLLSAVFVSVALASPATSATILNGSFEADPGVSGNFGASFAAMPSTGRSWDVWDALPGWTTTSGPGIEIQTNRTLGNIDAHDGDYYVELDSHGGSDTNSAMAQSVFLQAGTYEFSFYYSPRRNDVATNGIDYAVSTSGGTLASGAATGPGGGTQVGQWTQYSAVFDLAVADTVIFSFAATGRDDSLGGLLDSVSLAPVPLPAAGVMLLAGLGGLSLLRARLPAAQA